MLDQRLLARDTDNDIDKACQLFSVHFSGDLAAELLPEHDTGKADQRRENKVNGIDPAHRACNQ